MKSFKGKVAAITGAGSGIGRGLALQLAEHGTDLALCDVNEAALEETARRASEKGVHVTTAIVDVSDRERVHAWADEVVADHGRVNLIFNNAGVTVGSTIEDVTYEDFEWVMNINFWGVVYGTKAFMPYLRASGDGHVVNISSVFGLLGVPGQGSYNATKFAVRGFTEALRQELEIDGAPVSATSVHPGGIKTNIARGARMSARLGERIGRDGIPAEMVERLFITSATDAAKAILRGIQKNRSRVLVGPDAHAIDALVRLTPRGMQLALVALGRRVRGSV